MLAIKFERLDGVVGGKNLFNDGFHFIVPLLLYLFEKFHFALSFAVLMEAMPPFCSHYTTKSRGGQGVAKQITPKAFPVARSATSFTAKP